MIDAKKSEANCHGQLCKKRIAKAYNKKIWPRDLQERDLVLGKILPMKMLEKNERQTTRDRIWSKRLS